jgi:HAD superfamily hydrolase (TIGR01509 family)
MPVPSPSPAAPPPDWSTVDTVLLDLDGTLLDLAFDNFVWMARIPEIYAERNGLSLEEAQSELMPQFLRLQGRMEWYCIDHWSRQLRIDVAQVHREEAARVAWLPGARGFLERLRAAGKRLVLMTNSHPRIVEIKHERTRVLDWLDKSYSSHEFRSPKETPEFWAAARATEGFDPARTVFVDDSAAVLRSAIDSGIRHVYAVRRPDSSRDPHAHEEFAAIDSVADLA